MALAGVRVVVRVAGGWEARRGGGAAHLRDVTSAYLDVALDPGDARPSWTRRDDLR